MNAAVAQSKPILPGILSLLLIMALGISLAKLMWLVLTPSQKTNTKIQQVSQSNNATKQKVNYGKLIANQHLFGQVKKVARPIKAPIKAAPVKVAPPKKLNLKLHGVVSYKSKGGFALISSNNGRQKVYEKGDELEKGVSILGIYPGKVALNNNGQKEDLLLPVKETKGKSKPTARKTSPRPNNRAGNSYPSAPPQQRRNLGNPAPVAKKPDLSNFRQQVMENPRKLMDIASPSAAIVGGNFIGFRVQPGRDRKLFRQLGFRPNDIITEVNGIVLDDASKGASVLSALSQATEISVKVKRGNQEIFIQHSF